MDRGGGIILEEFPIIHTNIWDALIAVPVILIVTQIIKYMLPVAKASVPSIASGLGFIISIFIAHPNNLASGIFMGAFYGNAAVGVYASLKTNIRAFLDRRKKSKKTRSG
ncbi:hypothetical protein LCL89_10285 [Halobacillus yeomjeoni]|uniref:hypothetical protein n=1 Tax=Halobacillus yeomjeoni TaxID=311194 RepID=UPI001CD19DF1|nr:hypothetical protein [Halobacillus yeomjeoni]MCA0984434.1 hypothetical protein [Halobacillus yeomjeoni]